MKSTHKQTLIAGILTMVALPFVALGVNTEYGPSDVRIITLEERTTDRYELSLQINDGGLYSFDEVVYDDSRYELFEDIARNINDHRLFHGFDDEDIVDLIYGDFPFVKNDIRSAEVFFTEELVTVTLTYQTGDSITFSQDPERRFTNPNEAADFVRDMINSQGAFDGSYDRVEIYEIMGTFNGVEYYAPEVSRIDAAFDDSDEDPVILVTVYFENGETRSFETPFKENKQKITEDIAILISELYSQREEGVLLRSDITDKITWIDLPRLIDDISQVSVNIKNERIVYIEVQTILETGLLAFSLFEAPFTAELDDEQAVAIVVADTLESSLDFSPDFDLNDLISRINYDDIDFSRYEISEESSEPVAEQADIETDDFEFTPDVEEQEGTDQEFIAPEVKTPENILRIDLINERVTLYFTDDTGAFLEEQYVSDSTDSLEEAYGKMADIINSDPRYTEFTAESVQDLYDGDLPPHDPGLSEAEETQYLLLLELILLFIQENGLSIDLSGVI